VQSDSAFNKIQDMSFLEEYPTKTWRLVDPNIYQNYNHLTLTSHRILFETSRAKGIDVHSSLVSDHYPGMIRRFLEFFHMLSNLVYSLLTLGSQPFVTVAYKSVLLKDVININVEYRNYSDLFNQVLFNFYLCFFATIFVFSHLTSYIFGLMSCLQILVTTMKFKFWKSNSLKEQSLPNMILVLANFAFMVTFVIFESTTIYIHTTWIIVVVGIIGSLIALGLIRFNILDRQQKSTLVITTRRGTHSISLKNEDSLEAKSLIWKSRTDVPKFSL